MSAQPFGQLRELLPAIYQTPTRLGFLLGVDVRTVKAWLRHERTGLTGPNSRKPGDQYIQHMRALVAVATICPSLLPGLSWGTAWLLELLTQVPGPVRLNTEGKGINLEDLKR